MVAVCWEYEAWGIRNEDLKRKSASSILSYWLRDNGEAITIATLLIIKLNHNLDLIKNHDAAVHAGITLDDADEISIPSRLERVRYCGHGGAGV